MCISHTWYVQNSGLVRSFIFTQEYHSYKEDLVYEPIKYFWAVYLLSEPPPPLQQCVWSLSDEPPWGGELSVTRGYQAIQTAASGRGHSLSMRISLVVLAPHIRCIDINEIYQLDLWSLGKSMSTWGMSTNLRLCQSFRVQEYLQYLQYFTNGDTAAKPSVYQHNVCRCL